MYVLVENAKSLRDYVRGEKLSQPISSRLYILRGVVSQLLDRYR